ncbi:MAG: type II toxin-antitoxin system RelE/ParE family toxin, partial [Chryseobacterium sp.]|nr:type II toxin-antitoxin system RelE/ParE family toxin [Chryseobacterium sp.]
DEFRAVPLKKYPFLIFYLVDTEKKIIVISRIFHTSQNPEKYP